MTEADSGPAPDERTATVLHVEEVPLVSAQDVVLARQRARDSATRAGLATVDRTRLEVATSELARNCLTYGGGGCARIEHVRKAVGAQDVGGVRVVITDDGPGIADVELAMTQGRTSGTGLGAGLPGARNLADYFDLVSAPGRGTTATIVFWSRP